MTGKLTKTGCLLGSRSNLLEMRQELWLTEAEAAAVDRGIAALDQLIEKFHGDDRPDQIFAHHYANNSERI